jgi:putative transposase
MARGFVYLVAIVDWFSRRVLAWRVSITLDVDFCIEAVEEALARFGKPEIFNTDQGSLGGFKRSSQRGHFERFAGTGRGFQRAYAS